MGFLGLGKNKPHQSSDPREREAAVRAMPVADQGTLCELALGDDDPKVRVAAAAKIRTRENLELLAKHKDSAVAQIAKDRLAGMVMDELKLADAQLGKQLLAHVAEQSALLDVALTAKDASVRQAGFDKLVTHAEVSERTLATAAIQETSGAYGRQILDRISTRALLKDIGKKAKADDLKQAAKKRMDELETEAKKPSPEKLRRQLREGLATLAERAQILAVSGRWEEADTELTELFAKRDAELAAVEVEPDAEAEEHLAVISRARETFDRRRQEAEQAAAEAAANAEAKEALLSELAGLQADDEDLLVGARKRWTAIGDAGEAEIALQGRFAAWLAERGAASEEEAEVAEAAAAAAEPIELSEEEAAELEPVLVEAEELVGKEGAWRDRDYRYKELDKILRTKAGHLPKNHPVRQRFMDAYFKFKDARRADREALDKERQQRLDQMKGLLTEAEALAAKQPGDGDIDAHLKELQALQGRWRGIGNVPATMLGDLRDRFRAFCDEAYKPVRARNEARDAERMAKVPQAEELIAKAGGLTAVEDPAERHAAVRDLQKAWKDIGRLPREKNDELWQAFKAACDAVYDSLQDWFAERDQVREAAATSKQALIDELDGIVKAGSVGIAGSIADREAREDRSGRVKEIQAEWKEAGPAPRAVDNDLWKTFKGLLDTWYAAKRKEYEAKDAERVENLHQKTALCIALEELAEDATSFMSGTKVGSKKEADLINEMKDLARQWRNIGHVPRDNFEAIRARYSKARETFDAAMEPWYAKQDEDRTQNLSAKEALLTEIEELLKEERPDWFKDQARDIQQKWREVGPVPRSEAGINDRFNEACDKIFNHRPPEDEAVVSFERQSGDG